MPAAPQIRPTADRVREALFSILGDRVEGVDFLDGFAGTGAVGIEALSRGARRAVFLERSGPVIDCLRMNLRQSGLEDRGEIRRGDVAGILEQLNLEKRDFRMVFLDPPYQSHPEESLIGRIGVSSILGPDGWVILEHSSRVAAPTGAGDLTCFRNTRYGDTTLSFFRPSS